MRTLQLYATGTGSASAVAQVTIPAAARIRGVQVSLMVDCDTNAGYCKLELSKVPSTQIAVNGAQDPFLEVSGYNNLATSGMTFNAVNKFFPLDVACRQGEIVYLHAAISGTIQYYFTAILHYD